MSQVKILKKETNGDVATLVESADSIRVLSLGVGVAAPVSGLTISGSAEMTGFKLTAAPTVGFVLTSDAAGVGNWAAIPASGIGGSGTTGKIPKFTAGTTLGDSVLTENAGSIGIGTATPDSPIHLGGANPRIRFINAGLESTNYPAGPGTYGTGDKLVFWDDGTGKTSIAFGDQYDMLFLSTGSATLEDGFKFFTPSKAIGTGNANLQVLTTDIVTGGFGANVGGSILLGGNNSGASTPTPFGYIWGRKENGTDGNQDGYLAFGTRTSAGGNIANERMRIMAAGNVGIGTAAPQSKLGVAGGVAIGATYGGTNAAPASGLIVEGNVGIGTTTPLDQLHVDANAAVAVRVAGHGAGAYGVVTLLSSNGTSASPTASASGDILAEVAMGGYTGSGYADRARIFAYATQTWTGSANGTKMEFVTTPNGSVTPAARMTIEQNGFVGIGATSPLYKLHVVAGANPGVSAAIIHGDNNGLITGTLSTSATDFAFDVSSGMTNTGSGAIERFVVMADGKVGIGTTTPQSKLDVEGNVAIGAAYSGTTAAPTNGLIVEGNTSIGTTSDLAQLAVDNGAVAESIFVARDNGTAVFTVADGGDVTATQNVTVQKRILGASAAISAANDLTLGTANLNVVSGATQINALITAGWTAGSHVTLKFLGAPLVKHNTAGGGGTAVMSLAASSDFQAAADSILGLIYDGTQWHETFRKVA